MNEFNYRKLRGKITEMYGSQTAFAKILNVVPLTVSRKLCGESSFTRDEMLKWATALGIERDEITAYFFE